MCSRVSARRRTLQAVHLAGKTRGANSAGELVGEVKKFEVVRSVENNRVRTESWTRMDFKFRIHLHVEVT